MSTYKAKYYYHRQVKKAGFCLIVQRKIRMIEIEPNELDAAKANKYITKLCNDYHYGLSVVLMKQATKKQLNL